MSEHLDPERAAGKARTRVPEDIPEDIREWVSTLASERGEQSVTGFLARAKSGAEHLSAEAPVSVAYIYDISGELEGSRFSVRVPTVMKHKEFGELHELYDKLWGDVLTVRRGSTPLLAPVHRKEASAESYIAEERISGGSLVSFTSSTLVTGLFIGLTVASAVTGGLLHPLYWLSLALTSFGISAAHLTKFSERRID